ncbi:MAG: hypothetical protein KC910_22210 [Candidatus Eremiobacteraeota bacterium]|nr:hypothetical protein [Candidatus Eremiobacteraeota bacterium]
MKKTLLVTLIVLVTLSGLAWERHFKTREFVVIGELSQTTEMWLEKSGCDLVREDNQLLVRVHDPDKTVQALRYALEYHQLAEKAQASRMGMFIVDMNPTAWFVEPDENGRARLVQKAREREWVYNPTSPMAVKEGPHAGYVWEYESLMPVGADRCEARMLITWMRQLSDRELLFPQFDS